MIPVWSNMGYTVLGATCLARDRIDHNPEHFVGSSRRFNRCGGRALRVRNRKKTQVGRWSGEERAGV